MIKKLLPVLLISALMPFNMEAEWVSIDNNKTSNSPPKVTLISDDNNSSVFKIDISGFDLKEFISDGKSFQSMDLLTDIFTTEAGYPELPHIARVFAIPDLAGISFEILETGTVQTFTDIYLPPARSSWFEGEPESPYEENTEAYQSDDVYPKELVKIDPPAIFRDFRIARVSFFPVRYVPAKKELQVVSSVTIRINYGPGEVVNPKTTPSRGIAPSFARLYRSFIFNYQSVLETRYDGRDGEREVILCIMPDEFTASFQIYADWKRQSGTDVHVTKFSDIGANSSNPDIIRNHIADAYHNWEYPPTYVLIVGDEGVFPHKIVSYPDYSFPNEDYFVEIDGNDFFPEMMIGRFTNQGDYRMQVMINKFLLYEQNPYTAEPDWFKKSICCSNNAYASQVGTKRFTAAVMREDGGFAVDTLMSNGTGWGGQGCTMDVDDVVDLIEEGRSYLNYRGEGWYSGWSASCYDFNTNDVSSLQNGQKFTFVTSIGCGVAGFQSNGGNCFGESWVQLGSLTAPRGGCAFIGPTSNTHTTYNNKIDKGIYVGMFQDGMDTPGQALLRGKLYMYNVFGPDYYCEYHYKVFCILGDPSMHIWKDVPLPVTVDHPSSITVGNTQLEITITHTASGLPVDSAIVCLAGSEIFTTAHTDASGKAYINLTAEGPDTLMVTVRGGNVFPYQGTMLITQEEEHIEPEGEPVIVDLDGNLDGLINPNEHCEVIVTLKNWGTNSVSNIQCTLSLADTTYAQVMFTSPVYFGNLAPGSSSTGSPFQFFVKPNCPIGELLILQLHVTSSNSTWDYNYNAKVSGCQLSIGTFVVNDQGNPNMNFRVDPGETVKFYLSVENTGDDIAPEVMGILSSNDPYVTIQDSIGSFGSINIDSLGITGGNHYQLSVNASCPTGYLAECTLKLYTQNGLYPYESIPTFGLPISLLIPADYTGPDEYGYYAYASSDAFYEQTPEFDWVEIGQVGTQIIIPNVSDYTTTVDIPFNFQYYGIDYNQIRISTDGWMAFGSGTQTSPYNTSIPYYDNINNMLAVFWDDLYDIDLAEGRLLYYDDDANHRFIIEWDSIAHNDLGAEPKKEVFQAILLDQNYYQTLTGDGEIIYQYKVVKDITSNTIGIENNTQTIGLKYVYNQSYNPTAAELEEGLAIKFTTELPFTSFPVSVDHDKYLTSDGYSLEQNRPNPFNSNTRINYTIPESANVVLNIYNLKGELVRTLQNGQQPAGKHSVEWKGLNDHGNALNSGIYFYSLQTGNFIKTMKLFMLK
nr:T9SS type A sorting domain-containing protein [Bacteroidota bacterium]